MFYGPAASELAEADSSVLEAATQYNGYQHHSVLIQEPRVLRWSQGVQPWEDIRVYDKEMPEKLLALTQEREMHLGYLATLGITIPEHNSFIGCSPFEPGATVLYDRVNFVEGTGLLNINNPTILARLGAILEYYLQWCKTVDNERYMSDIFAPTQYILTPEEELTLVDIEPLFMSLRSSGAGNRWSLDDAQIYIEHYHQGKHW